MPLPRQAGLPLEPNGSLEGPPPAHAQVSLLVESQLDHSRPGSLPLWLVLFYHQDPPVTHCLLGEAKDIPGVVL